MNLIDALHEAEGSWIHTDDLGYGMVVENRITTLLVKFDLAVVEINAEDEFQWTDIPDFSSREMI